MPPVTVNDLNNAKLDCDTIGAAATSSALTVTDRLGNTKNTLSGVMDTVMSSATAVLGSIGYLPPVAYASGLSITLATQTVEFAGQTYAPKLSAVPFTASAGFDAAFWRLIQGVTPGQLAVVADGQLKPVTTSPAYFFGDSITVGVGASTPALNWVNRLAASMGWSVANNAISGGIVMDWVAQQLFSMVPDDAITCILPGFNDARGIHDNLAQQAAYKLALYDGVAFAAIPSSQKVWGDDARITYSGSWVPAELSAYFRVSSELNATATFEASGDAVYISGIQQAGSGGLMNVVVDGLDRGTFEMSQSVVTGGISGLNYQPCLVRVAGLGDGRHTVVCKNVGKSVGSAGASIYIRWVAGSAAAAKTSARVYVGNTLRMRADAVSPVTDAVTNAFCAMSQAVCADLASDGLDVQYVDANAVYDPYTQVHPDLVHPNDAGYGSIYKAFAQAISRPARTAVSTGGVSGIRQLNRRVAKLEGATAGPVLAWTPVLRGGTVPGAHTYAGQYGLYTIEGRVCTTQFRLAVSVVDRAMSGYTAISLPVPCSAVIGGTGLVGSRVGVTLGAGASGLYLETIPGSSQMVLRQAYVEEANLPVANIANGADIRGTITYLIA